MEKDLLLLFSDNGRVSEISCKAVVVYMILRSDVYSRKGSDESKRMRKLKMLASAMSIDDISKISGFTIYEVKVAIDELQRMKLVKRSDSYYQLGEYRDTVNGCEPFWFELETKSQLTEKLENKEKDKNGITSMKDQIMQLVKRRDAEKRAVGARLAEHTKQSFIQNTLKDVKKEVVEKPKKASKVLFDHYSKCFMAAFGKTAKFANGAPRDTSDQKILHEGMTKTNVYMLRLYKYYNEDLEKAKRIIEFVIKGWDSIKLVLNLDKDAELNVGLLTSKWFMDRVLAWEQTGIPVWRVSKKPSISNDRINRKYEPSKVDEDFASDSDAGTSFHGDFN